MKVSLCQPMMASNEAHFMEKAGNHIAGFFVCLNAVSKDLE